MTITTGAIERSVVREIPDGFDPESLDAFGEIEQMIQIEVSGTATAAIVWTTVDVTFDVDFLDANDQRYSNLEEPHFTFGSKSAGNVMLAARVAEYAVDDRGVIAGATIAVGAVNPGGSSIDYEGRVDLSFQGWGCLASEPADPEFN